MVKVLTSSWTWSNIHVQSFLTSVIVKLRESDVKDHSYNMQGGKVKSSSEVGEVGVEDDVGGYEKIHENFTHFLQLKYFV